VAPVSCRSSLARVRPPGLRPSGSWTRTLLALSLRISSAALSVSRSYIWALMLAGLWLLLSFVPVADYPWYENMGSVGQLFFLTMTLQGMGNLAEARFRASLASFRFSSSTLARSMVFPLFRAAAVPTGFP